MRFALVLLALIGCGASEEPAPTSPAPAEPTAPAPAEPAPSAPDRSTWYACTAASDCALVPGVCGSSVAANTAHVAEVTAEQQALQAAALCAPTSIIPMPMHYHVECVSNVCTAVLDPLPEAES